MNFYLDIEATQPENEIISIGVITENAEETFYSLVKPQFSKVSSFINKLTGLSGEDLIEAPTLDEVFKQLYDWCLKQSSNTAGWRFYSYGDDRTFIKASEQNIFTHRAFLMYCILMTRIEDFSEKARKFFCGRISLIDAFNYVKSNENKQKHNALEDATMLLAVAKGIKDKEPLKLHPRAKTINNIDLPIGRVFCSTEGKNAKTREFTDIEAAINWIIYNTCISKKDRDNVNTVRMAKKIIESAQTGKKYGVYKWRIEK